VAVGTDIFVEWHEWNVILVRTIIMKSRKSNEVVEGRCLWKEYGRLEYMVNQRRLKELLFHTGYEGLLPSMWAKQSNERLEYYTPLPFLFGTLTFWVIETAIPPVVAIDTLFC
jgi:hypothetical protein